jgi:hypothetical protein
MIEIKLLFFFFSLSILASLFLDDFIEEKEKINYLFLFLLFISQHIKLLNYNFNSIFLLPNFFLKNNKYLQYIAYYFF